MKEENVNYYLPLFKSNGNYLRVTRNSAFVVPCPAPLRRQLNSCCSLLLVGDPSLTKFVIVGFTDKPYFKVYDYFKVKGLIDERIRLMMKTRMIRHMLCYHSHALPNQLRALDTYLDSTGHSLFS